MSRRFQCFRIKSAKILKHSLNGIQARLSSFGVVWMHAVMRGGSRKQHLRPEHFWKRVSVRLAHQIREVQKQLCLGNSVSLDSVEFA